MPTLGASLVTQMIKSLPAVQETRIRPLGWDDPLEKEMATHSSILAWKIPWMEQPGGLQSMGSQRVGHFWATSLHLDPYGDKVVLRVTVHSLSCNQGQNLQWSKRQIIDRIFPIMASDFFCQENLFPAVQNWGSLTMKKSDLSFHSVLLLIV